MVVEQFVLQACGGARELDLALDMKGAQQVWLHGGHNLLILRGEMAFVFVRIYEQPAEGLGNGRIGQRAHDQAAEVVGGHFHLRRELVGEYGLAALGFRQELVAQDEITTVRRVYLRRPGVVFHERWIGQRGADVVARVTEYVRRLSAIVEGFETPLAAACERGHLADHFGPKARLERGIVDATNNGKQIRVRHDTSPLASCRLQSSRKRVLAFFSYSVTRWDVQLNSQRAGASCRRNTGLRYRFNCMRLVRRKFGKVSAWSNQGITRE